MASTIGPVRRLLVETVIIASWVFTMSFNFLALAEIRFDDVEAYLPEAEPNASESLKKIVTGLNLTYLISVVLPRLAMLNMYLPIFARQRVIRVTTAAVVANCIGSIIAGVFLCIPSGRHWDRVIHGRCFHMGARYRRIRLINILTDTIILGVPLEHIVTIQASIRVKTVLLVTFLLGSLGLLTATITWVEYLGIDVMTDSTWTGTTPLIWHIVAVGIYLILAGLLSY